MTSIRSCLTIAAACVALSACGGPSRPGPLKHHFDDMYLAKVPIDSKRSVLDAQQDWSIAKMELAKARQDYETAGLDVKVAQNDAKKAKLEAGTLKERKKIAEKAGDLTEINKTTLLLLSADLSFKAGQKKVTYMKAHRSYLRVAIDYAEDIMNLEEADYEMSKARMAQRHNIQPRGFVFANFQKQSERRARQVQTTKVRLEKARAKEEKYKKEWKAFEQQARAAERGANDSPPPPAALPPASPPPLQPLPPAGLDSDPPPPAGLGG